MDRDAIADRLRNALTVSFCEVAALPEYNTALLRAALLDVAKCAGELLGVTIRDAAVKTAKACVLLSGIYLGSAVI